MSQISTDLSNAPPEVLQYLANTPAIPAPMNVLPNFVDPETRKNTQVVTTSVILAFMLIFFFNRVYTKLFLMKKLTLDDGTIVMAFLSCIAYYVACTWGAEKGGYGTHQWNISILQAARMDLLIPSYMLSVVTPLTFLFLKATFFILYLQLFDTVKWLRFCSWVGLIFSSITYTIFTVLVFVWATPKPGESWLAHQTSADMHKELKLSVPQSIVGLVIDLYILIIPIIGVYDLTMTTKRKIGVMLIFLSGLMACICSACSIYYRVVLDHTADVTWALIPVNICTLTEMFVGVICACMPSAAYAARQTNSTYSRVLRSISSRFGSKYASSRESSQAEKTESHPQPDVLKSTDRKYAQYFSLNGYSATDSQLNEKTNMSATIDMPTFPSATASRTSSSDKISANDMV